MVAKMPTVSVCMPAYNQALYIGSALESVLAQTLGDFEVIVFDDGSTDRTENIVRQYHDARIRFFAQRRHVGVARTRNACIEVAHGRYISFLDADDRYAPGALERLASALDEQRNVGLVHGGFQLIGPEGEPLRTWDPLFDDDVVEDGQAAFEELVLSNYITTSTVMLRRDVLEEAGPFDTRIGRSGTDWHMWLRIVLRSDLSYRAQTIAEYRQHANTISRRAARSGEGLRNDVRLVRSVLRRERARISGGREVEDRARAALAMRGLLHSYDELQRDRRAPSVRSALLALTLAPHRLVNRRDWAPLVLAIWSRDEYAAYSHSKRILAQLYPPLDGSRYGKKVAKFAVVDGEWQRLTEEVARTVRTIVPEGERIITIDKHDPTLIRFSARDGSHFPELQADGAGVPKDSREALSQLRSQRERGFRYLVLPSSAFWWLDYYGEFRQHLEFACHRAYAGDDCVIYDLKPPSPNRRAGELVREEGAETTSAGTPGSPASRRGST